MTNPPAPTAAPPRPGSTRGSVERPLARLWAFYAVLAAVGFLIYRIAPDLPGLFRPGRFDQAGANGSVLSGGGGIASSIGALEAASEAVVAMSCAFLLMLPVAWVYILTRRKRGYQQSLVQTLVILPVVVAAVVILVKSSVALAFSLGGIVGAIAFRNRLEDTKDAVHVFVAIGVGVSCGVQVVSVAVALSVFYVGLNLALWWTDFGRVPAELGGVPAERRLAELRAAPNRRGEQFLSRIDNLLLQSMTPEQLAALAGRAEKRRERFAVDIGLEPTGELKKPKFDATLRVVAAPAELEAVKRETEETLASDAKYWQLDPPAPGPPGRNTLVYQVRLRKRVPGPRLLKAVRRGLADRATAELS